MTITTGTSAVGEAGQPRRARSVTFIRFILRFTEPAAITVPGFPDRDKNAPWGRSRAHLLVDTDPWRRPHLPGTSLAGALRELVCVAAGKEEANDLFGCLLPPGSGTDEVDARASKLWVLGSRPVDAEGTETSEPAESLPLRASTAICRTRGAARADTLRLEEVLPAGSRFEVFLRWDDAPEPRLSRLLDLLTSWRPVIGRGTSRGRGRCEAERVLHGTLNLADRDDLHKWLTASGPALARAVATTEVARRAPASTADPLLRVAVRILGPLRVGSGEPPEASGAQGQKVTPLFKVGDRFVLPGTGLKGLLRSRAEYILRSVGVTPPPCLDQRCGTCWTCEVFGHGGGRDVTARAVGARALVRVPDAEVSDPVPGRRQHVAIDRFTGGAQAGLLYTADTLEGGRFMLTVEPFADAGAADKAAEIRAVLRLVIEDLSDGITGVGAGVARGYGSVVPDLAGAGGRDALPSAHAARATLARMAAASSPEAAR